MQTPKKFSSFSDQVSWISDEKGIKIKDREYAEEMLRQIGYFPLMGGYKHLFRISNTKKYKAGTSFEEIVSLYKFDAELRELFFKYLLQIERQMRSLMSYYFTEMYGAEQKQYLDANNYNNTKRNHATIVKLIATLKRATTTTDYTYINYYRKTYGEIPLWVLANPFKVERNQELFELRCSIEKEGVLVPLLVRKNPHGDGYEIISGHRRKEAALWTGLTKVPVIIRELDDDQSVIAMIDSNLQREKILPSEKAFAYKMRLEAMKHQGRLESDTSDPLEPRYKTKLVNVSELEAEIQKLGKVKIQQKDGAGGKRSNEQLASMVGESVTQIKRYIRLTHLIPKIWDMVDKEILAIRSAVEISFLSEEEQYELHAVMELEHSIPNISQANRLKRMSQQKCLDMDKIYEILQEIKSNQKEQIKLPLERIGKYFPTAYTPKQQVDLIEKLLKNWAKQNVK